MTVAAGLDGAALTIAPERREVEGSKAFRFRFVLPSSRVPAMVGTSLFKEACMTHHHRRPENLDECRSPASSRSVTPSSAGAGPTRRRAVRRPKGRPRVVIYVRTARGRTHDEARQLAAARMYAIGIGGEVVGEVCDRGVSGTAAAARPKLEGLLESLRVEGCEVLVVESVDRLSRDVSTRRATLDQLDGMGVDVHTTRGGPFNPIRSMVRALLRDMADATSSRVVRLGRERAARKRAR